MQHSTAPGLCIQHHLFPRLLPRALKRLTTHPSPVGLPAGLQDLCKSSRTWFTVNMLDLCRD